MIWRKVASGMTKFGWSAFYRTVSFATPRSSWHTETSNGKTEAFDMSTQPIPPTLAQARAEFDELVRDVWPELHRYCARMTGSVVDGEDVVQDALAKAYYVLPTINEIGNLRAWLFRIAHNRAIDHLRRYERRHTEPLDEHPPIAEETAPLEDKELAAMALSLFVELSPLQRSCVFLKDVLGHSLAEISELHDVSVSSIKAALHRGRKRLRALAERTGETPAPTFDQADTQRLARYVDRFNAQDFEALRAMLADDARLDLIAHGQRRGAANVGDYFHRYEEVADSHLALGAVEGRLAILVHDIAAPDTPPVYFVLIDWDGDRIASIRDYRYARHVMRDADVAPLETAA
jgi:RNA polymerase sigma-70 factor (ECF subfamily)